MARRPRRRRRASWKSRFAFLFVGVILGVALGIMACSRYDILSMIDSLGTQETQIDGEMEQQSDIAVVTSAPLQMETPAPAQATPVPTAEPETTATPEPTPTVEPTPEPTATPEPTPTPAPTPEGTPTPRPIMTWAPQGEGKSAEEMRTIIEQSAQEADEEEPVATSAPTQQPVAEESAVEATPAPTVQADLSALPDAQAMGARERTNACTIGEWFTFETEIDENGEPYTGTDGAGKTVCLSMRVVDYLNAEDYAAQYGQMYQLFGSEAAFVLEIANQSDSVSVPVETAVRIAYANKADVLYDAYPLMDAPMAGNAQIEIAPGATVTLYKRFAWSENTGVYPFLTVTYTQNGSEYRSYFLLSGME